MLPSNALTIQTLFLLPDNISARINFAPRYQHPIMQIEPTMAVSKTVHSLCPEGDLALRIRLGDRENLLLVSSSLLSKASKPLSDRVDASRVPENLLGSSSKELSLVEDEGKAIFIICDIIHGRDSEVPDKGAGRSARKYRFLLC